MQRNSLGMELVLISAGTFKMGSNDSDAYAGERPGHTVRITQPFYLGKYEVTQSQWQAVMGNNPSTFTGDPNRPVDNVSWDDVQEFIRRLNSREGGTAYRLPTEAEWEYAARAGTTTRWSFGDDASQLGRYAWYEGNAGKQTHPVGQLQPNPWGLYDMYGNVWEWVQDWYGKYASDTAIDPGGPASGSDRVFRGGSWGNATRFCRSAHRLGDAPGTRFVDLGFRLLKVAQ
jgi:formylglycine-generating enzyme required for sulfatase activity